MAAFTRAARGRRSRAAEATRSQWGVEAARHLRNALAVGALIVLAGASPVGAQAFCSGTSPAPGPCVIAFSQTISGPIALAGRDLVLAANVVLTATAPSLSVQADNVTLESRAKILGAGTNGSGTDVEIATPGMVWVKTSASISTFADGAAGTLTVTAGGTVKVDGQLDAHAGRSGFAGAIVVTSAGGNVLLTGSAPVDGMAGDFGGGGELSVNAPAGDVTVGGTLDLSGGDGGSIDLRAGGVLTTVAVTGKLDVSATAAGSDAGDITLQGALAVTVAGPVAGRSAGDPADGAGAGANVVVLSGGDVTIGGQVDLTGPAPDGQGGGLTVAGAGVTLTGALLAPGKGVDGCGGYALLRATGPLALGPIDVSGGSCGGGTVDAVSRGALSAPFEVNGDGSRGGGGAALSLRAQDLRVTAKLHASGLDGDGPGGLITLHGCALNVSALGQVLAQGAHGANTLRANGPMVVNGPVIAGGKTCAAGVDVGKACLNDSRCTLPSPPATIPPTGLCTEAGVNRVEYADPAVVPAIAAGKMSPVPTQIWNPNLMPCVDPAPPPTTTTTLPSTTTSTSSTSTSTSTSTTSSTSTSSSSSTSTSSSTSSTTSMSTSSSTSSTTSTSTSSSTSSSSTTSTSEAPTTTTPTSSTTTSTIAACATAAACDDADPCTDDECRGGVCVFQPVGRVRAVTCRLDTMEADLRASPAADLGGALAQAKLLGKVSAMRRTVDAAGDPGSPRARRKLKAAGRQLQTFIGSVRRGQRRRKITPPIAERLLSTAGVAKQQAAAAVEAL